MTKTRLVIIGQVIAILILIVLIYTRREEIPQPQPEVVQSTSIAIVFGVASIDPPTDKLTTISSGTPIVVTFTKELDPNSLQVSTSQEMEILVEFSKKSVIFKPKTFWPADQVITISISSAQSIDGENLNPYQFTIKAPNPTF